MGEGSGQVQISAGPVPVMNRIITEELNEEVPGTVTGRPSRDHWKVRIIFLPYRGLWKLHPYLSFSSPLVFLAGRVFFRN